MLSQKQKIIFPKEKLQYKPEDKKEYLLGKEEELRLEVNSKEVVRVCLIEGFAEIEGLPLPSHPVYYTNRKLAIFCWKASKIEVFGRPDNCYIGKETPMISYLMSFYIIHELRTKALDYSTVGPKVIIMGSKSSGKRTLVNTLLNYSLKHGYKPIYVDISLHNRIGIPGTIGARVMDEPIPNEYLIENSLLLFHGNTTSISLTQSGTTTVGNKFNEDLYLKQLKELGDCVNEKLNKDLDSYLADYNTSQAELEEIQSESQDYRFPYASYEPQVYSAGSIIYCQTFEGFDIHLYKKAITYFDCNIVFVLDNDRLYSSLLTEFSSSLEKGTIKINKLQKSSGVSL